MSDALKFVHQLFRRRLCGAKIPNWCLRLFGRVAKLNFDRLQGAPMRLLADRDLSVDRIVFAAPV
jgi:hypothetical protein